MTDNDLTKIKFEDLFDKYKNANSSKHIIYYFETLCKLLNIDLKKYYAEKTTPIVVSSTNSSQTQSLSNTTTRILYQIIRTKHQHWKSNTLWNLYDKRLTHKDFSKRSKFKDLRILIIGCGPVGLRLSIDLALLGFKVVIVEKRDRFSRNNVLHLWPYTIVDLKNLGAKFFYGKFCAGSIDHISIRKLQVVLLKVALLLGVEVHFNVSFEELIEPTDYTGWRVKLLPENHVLSNLDFDVVIGADGRRNTLPGFKRKEFRGKLAIGITANFTNYFSNEEAEVQERSGVAFIFDQKFFLDLKRDTGIDLENIVYYKDDTHYFVMTAKKQSLIDKGVIKKDLSDANLLLSKENVNLEKLCDYAKEAAYVSTDKKLRRLDFAKNHYGQPDVAMFDFTSLFQAENASRFIERKGKRLLTALIGDSLLEPFWPLGTGIARGFLAAFDTAWMIRGFGLNKDPFDLLIQRESIFQLLSQTTVDNTSKIYQEYSIDPSTRYLNLTRSIKTIQENQIRHLYDDSKEPINSINDNIEIPAKKAKNDGVQPQTLLTWSQMVTQPYGIHVENLTTSWKSGLAFCAIIHRFRTDLLDYNTINKDDHIGNIKLAFDIMRNKLSSGVDATPEEIANADVPNKFTILMILDKIYAVFRSCSLNDVDIHDSKLNSLPQHVNETKDKKRKNVEDEVVFRKQKLIINNENNSRQSTSSLSSPSSSSSNNKSNKDKDKEKDKDKDKDKDKEERNSLKHISVNSIASLLKSKFESNSSNRPKSTNLSGNSTTNSTTTINTVSSTSNQNITNGITIIGAGQNSTFCHICSDKVYIMERVNVLGVFMHANCFRCDYCSRTLRNNNQYSHIKDIKTNKYTFYCANHVGMTNNKQTTLQRKKSFLTQNDDVKPRPDVTPNTRRRILDGSDSFRRKNNSSFRQRSIKNTNKTPERAEFELNVENKGLEIDRDDESDNYEDETDEINIDDEYDDDVDSQQNTSSGFLSKSVSEKTSNIDEFDAYNDVDDEIEDVDGEEEDDEEEGEEEEEEEGVYDDDGYDYNTKKNGQEITNDKNESEEENEDEHKNRNSLLNKKTDNLLFKLKLANNIINWESNINYNEQVNCVSSIRKTEKYDDENENENENKKQEYEEELKNNENIKEYKNISDDMKSSSTESSEINSGTSNESIYSETKIDENDKSLITHKPYIPNNSFSRLKKFNIKQNNQNEVNKNNEVIKVIEIDNKSNNQVVETVEQVVPTLPKSSPPPLDKIPLRSTVTIVHKSKLNCKTESTNNNKQKRSFICNICKQVASITQRISIQNQLFHRDCIKCSVCGVTVKSVERFIRGIDEKIDFFCATHAPEKKIGSSLSIPDDEDEDELKDHKTDDEIETNLKKTEEMIERQNELLRNIDKLNLDDRFINKHNKEIIKEKSIQNSTIAHTNDFDNTSCNNSNNNSNEKNISSILKVDDNQASRQKLFDNALERIRLKSDAALGIITPDNIKNLISSATSVPLTSTTNTTTTTKTVFIAESKIENEIDEKNNKDVFNKIFDKAKENVKCRLQKDKEHNDVIKSPRTATTSAPIATIDDIDDFSIDENLNNKTVSSINTSATNSTANTNSTKMTTIDSLNSNLTYSSIPSQTPIIPKLNDESTKKDDNKDVKPKNLKFVLNGFSPITNDEKPVTAESPTTKKKSNLKNKFLSPPKTKTKTKSSTSPSPSQSPFNNSRDSTKSPVSNSVKSKGKYSPAGILKTIIKTPIGRKNQQEMEENNQLNNQQQQQQQETSNSFNAFNVTHSPRLTRNSRIVKRQQNEEKRLEKQRRDKRLRMSQEIQRKLDEIETKLHELETEGVELEKVICIMDNENERKEKLEQELYNLIHQKNLLTRVENELNIQSRALAIEDQLSECQQKLRETLNLPAIHVPKNEKSRDVMEAERNTMERIVELVEEKNQLVEQLEQLRLIERQEDTEVTQILSGKGFNLYQPNDLNKYLPYKDII